MKIAFNPSTVAALITPPNNKDITFDLRGRNIFARGVKFQGTDTWRDIKINNVSIGSNILDLRNGSNTTLTNTNGVVTINSTWRPVVDNLTSDSTTSSLSANQGRVLAGLINTLSTNISNQYALRNGSNATGRWRGGLACFDVRGTNYAPSDLNMGLELLFLRNNTNNLKDGGEYNGVFSFRQWASGTDWSGGKAHQLSFTDNGNIWHRTSSGDDSWGTWKKLAYSTDIPSSLKNPHALTISLNGTSQGPYDGSAAKNINITPGSIGAADVNHTHGLLHSNLTVTLDNTTTDSGWSMINSSYNGFLLKSIRTQGSAPNWIENNYAAGICFGGADTKGVVSVAYGIPYIKFAGGNGSKPVWWIRLSGISGVTYNLANFNADTLDGYHANGLFTALSNSNNGISITVGGTTKSVSNISVNYASSAGNANTVDGYHASAFVKMKQFRFNQYNQGTWTKILTITINSTADLQPVIAFSWIPSECNRDIWADFSISWRSNSPIFYAIWKGMNSRTLKVVNSSGAIWDVWVSGNKTGWDPFGEIQVTYTHNITSYNGGSLGYSDIDPGGTICITGGQVNYSNSAGSATKVIVNQHTANDTNYPLVWSNQNNSNTVTENQLYKSWSDLYYNPKNKRLTVGGSIYAAHFYESSDKTLKKNIKSILSSTNIPKIREFDWKDTGEHSYGFIAQELEEQGYGCLVSEANGKKTVNYTATLALTVAKLQNLINIQNKKISNLTKELKALKYGRKKNS